MANFAVRVELRGNPSYEKYLTLHQLMKRGGFHQTITGTNNLGKSHTTDMPHATYFGSSAYNAAYIRDQLVTAIKANVQKDIIVFVAKVDDWARGE